MKKLLALIFLFVAFKASAQTYTLNYDSVRVGKTPNSSILIPKDLYLKGLPKGLLSIRADGKVIHNDTLYALATSAVITGRTISSLPTIGQVVTTGTPDQVFEQLFAQTQVPTAALSGGTTYELGVAASTHNLSYSYGRQMATATISTAVITPGPLNVYSTQPAQPGTVSGTQSVTTPTNTNRTYTLTVTTSDGKTATATTTDTWLPGRYWGRSSSATPDNAIILAVAGGDKSLSSSVAGTFTITASGSNYPFFAYPSSEAALTSIKDVNGFEVKSAFNITTVSVTNVNGFVQNYRVYTLNSTTASNYQITTL